MIEQSPQPLTSPPATADRPRLLSLAWALTYVLLFLGLVAWMYRKRIIIKV